MPSGNNPPFLAIGKVSVAASGTPVGLLDLFGGNPGIYKSTTTAAQGGLNFGLKLRVVSILFAVIGGLNVNTGLIYVGFKGMNKGTGVGVLFAIPASAAGVVNWFTLPAQGFGAGNELTPEDIFIDADTNGNSVQVTCTMY